MMFVLVYTFISFSLEITELYKIEFEFYILMSWFYGF